MSSILFIFYDNNKYKNHFLLFRNFYENDDNGDCYIVMNRFNNSKNYAENNDKEVFRVY